MNVSIYGKNDGSHNVDPYYITNNHKSLFGFVEVLRPSQPNGVMSRAVNLPNHTFTTQA